MSNETLKKINNDDGDDYHDNINIRPRLFGTNGVRGVFGKELTIDLVIDLSYSLATYFKNGPIIIGHDGRKSSPILSKLVSSTINSAALDTCNVGLLPTPCLQYAVKKPGCSGGIMITASHNPPEYNGLKPIAEDGVEISREDELKVEDVFYSKDYSKVDGYGLEYTRKDVINSYIEAVLSLVDIEKIRERKFSIVMDTGNGVQAAVAPFLASKLGCKITTINGNIDGNFPSRGSEPTADNLTMLSNLVKDTKADFGVAYDGDGDRSIFCDEKGVVYPGDKTGTLLVKHLLINRHSGAEVVCPVNTTMALPLMIEKESEKSNVIYTKVGSVEVSREMVRRKALIGLEENGGFMYGKLNEVRDGAMTTALMLDMLAVSSSLLSGTMNSMPTATSSTDKEKKEVVSLSKLMETLPKVFQYKSKFNCPSKQVARQIIKECINHGSPHKVETLDGVKLWIDKETWIMIRPSGTEPLIRIYAESTDEALLNSKVAEYSRIIQKKISVQST
jgi:phosphomannomutase/phosphoglucomutase